MAFWTTKSVDTLTKNECLDILVLYEIVEELKDREKRLKDVEQSMEKGS